MLRTPGYWAWGDGVFVWNAGYWAPQIGFYGGIFYGFGYVGVGYAGGYWSHGAFFYNRSVNNVTNVTNFTNVYDRTVVNNASVNNVSYNGGAGGTTARPTAAEQAAARARHVAPTAAQIQQEQATSSNRALLASVNRGKPAIATTPKPGVFTGQGVLEAKAAAPYHPPALPRQRRSAPLLQVERQHSRIRTRIGRRNRQNHQGRNPLGGQSLRIRQTSRQVSQRENPSSGLRNSVRKSRTEKEKSGHLIRRTTSLV